MTIEYRAQAHTREVNTNMADNHIGPIKDSYSVMKEICGGVYAGLSLIFPQIPAYVASRQAECLLAACKASQEKLRAASISLESQRACTLKLGLPWIEWASLEEDPSLRDLWANLLANELNPNKPEPRTAFISIIKDLSPLDAQLLNKVYKDARRATTKAPFMPYAPTPLVMFFDTRVLAKTSDAEDFDVRVSIQNLKQCSLIDDLPVMQKIEPREAKQIGGATTGSRVFFQHTALVPPDPNKFRLTELGCLFLDSCVADAGQAG